MKLLYIAIIIANTTDWITTRIGLWLGDKLYGDLFGEANPISVMNMTPPVADLMKLLFIPIMVFIYSEIAGMFPYPSVRKAIAIFTIMGIIVFTYATLHNIDQIVYMLRS